MTNNPSENSRADLRLALESLDGSELRLDATVKRVAAELSEAQLRTDADPSAVEEYRAHLVSVAAEARAQLAEMRAELEERLAAEGGTNPASS